MRAPRRPPRAGGDDVHVGGRACVLDARLFRRSGAVVVRALPRGRARAPHLPRARASRCVYVKDDTAFNESFAVTVEEEGVARWLAQEAKRRDPSDAARLAADFARGQRSRAEFRAMIVAARERLPCIYAAARATKKARGQGCGFRRDARRERAPEGGDPRARRRSIAGSTPAPNNAGIAAAGFYADRVPQFKAVLDEEGGDLPRFYEQVRALAALAPGRSELALAQAARS